MALFEVYCSTSTRELVARRSGLRERRKVKMAINNGRVDSYYSLKLQHWVQGSGGELNRCASMPLAVQRMSTVELAQIQHASYVFTLSYNP